MWGTPRTISTACYISGFIFTHGHAQLVSYLNTTGPKTTAQLLLLKENLPKRLSEGEYPTISNYG